MTHRPQIQTAIPQHRYRFGEFDIVVLGEIKSPDAADYRYILAVVKDGMAEPLLYITSERKPPHEQSEGAYVMRVITAHSAQLVGVSNRWGDLDCFTEDALEGVRQLFNLTDEALLRLL